MVSLLHRATIITHNIYDAEVSPNLKYYPKSNTTGKGKT